VLLSQKFDSIAKIRTVGIPVLVVHGEADRFVPVALLRGALPRGERAEEAAAGRERSHNNSMWTGDGAYQRAIVELFGLHAAPEGRRTSTERARRCAPAPRARARAARAIG